MNLGRYRRFSFITHIHSLTAVDLDRITLIR
jgi:hypothetical protein